MLVLLGGCVSGLLLYPFLQPEFSLLVAAITAVSALALAGRASARVGGVAVAVIGVLLGLAAPARLPDPPLLRGEWRLRGRVVSAAYGQEADVAVAALSQQGGWQSASGRVRVRFPETPPSPGRVVVLSGAAFPMELHHLPHGLDPVYALLRARVVSRLVAKEVLVVGPMLPVFDVPDLPNAGLLQAMLDGRRGGIPEETRALLRRTGTSHLLSISGMHIGLCASGAWFLARVLLAPLALLWRRGGLRWLQALAAISAAVLYAGMAGFPLPAVRAAWVAGAIAVGRALHHRLDLPSLLALAAVASLLGEPSALDNPSFLLSYGAMTGLMVVPWRVLRYLPLTTPWPLRALVGALASSLGATIGTLPATAWFFQELPPLSPIANLWAVPWIGAAATTLLLLGAALPAPVGPWLLWLADRASAAGLWGLTLLPDMVWTVAGTLPGVLLAAAAVLLWRRHLPAMLACAGLALGLHVRPSGGLVVRFLSIGQGDAALVTWPDGRSWLIDGGPWGEALLQELRRSGVERLERVILSHPHPDHMDGLKPVLAALPVAHLHVSQPAPALSQPGMQVHLGLEGAPGLELLHPQPDFAPKTRDPVNDQSLVAALRYGAHRFLFVGDIEAEGEAALLRQDLHADVLKVPHHGSKTSSSAALLQAVDPAIAVISCGRDNPYGHPHPAVLARYRGVRVLRTDQLGTVELRSDGTTLQVRALGAPQPWMLSFWSPLDGLALTKR